MDDRTIFNLITEAIRGAIEDPAAYLPPLVPSDEASLGTALDDLDAASQSLDNAGDLGEWIDRARNWRDSVDTVAAEAFPTAGNEAFDNLFVRFLQKNFPRTAATLVVAGIITTETDTSVDPPATRHHVDWEGLQDFITDPETLVNEETWEDLFADLGHPHSGRLPAVLVGLLIMTPRTILSIARGELAFEGPTPPPVRSDPSSPWAQFRTASEDWFSFTLPFGDPASADPKPPGALYWRADLEPDLSATLALRSDRRDIGGGPVTDFEAWLALGIDRDHWQIDLGDHWYLRIEPGITAGFGRDGGADEWHGAFAPLAVGSPFLPARPEDPVTVSLGREVPDGKPDIMFGPPYDTRFLIKDIELFLKFREDTPQFEIGARVEELALVIAPRWFRTFGQPSDFWREGIRFDLNLDIAYGVGRGVTLNLTSGLEFVMFLDAQLGDDSLNFKLHTIRIACELQGTTENFYGRANITIHASGQLGPVGLVIDGIGAWLGWWPVRNDDTGEDEPKWIGFIPPTGAGLSIEIGPVIGGGFVDWQGGPTDRYAGLIYVKVYAYEVTAFGIHERTPEGRTSVIAVLGARFSPGIHIAYGFFLTGLGGLVAINRRLDTDALRERLTSGAVGNVLFAPDPVKNAPIILGDLDALFPLADNVHVAGPTARISWIGVVHFDFGLLFEIAIGANVYDTTGLTKIVLLGSAHSRIPEQGDKKLIDLQLDLSGFVDMVLEVIEFDAALVRSRILEVFIITGDSAFRLSWGDRPYGMLTLGGFHPNFNPEPAQFPEMARMGLAYDTGGSVRLWLRLEHYFAVTTNTVQTGAMVEAGIKAGPINAVGWIGFDALIQFRPFYFEISFGAGFRVRVGSMTFAGVKVKGTISGPGPLTLAGEFCIEILFFDICWEDSFAIGSAAADVIASVASLLDEMESELANLANLASEATGDRFVAASEALTAGDEVPNISPIAQLTWAQRRAPLDMLITRFEGAPLRDGAQAVVASSPHETGVVTDWFAPGANLDLTAAQAINMATCVRGTAGLKLGFDQETGKPVPRNVTVNQYVLPRTTPLLVAAIPFPQLVIDSAYGRSANASEFIRTSAAIKVQDESWSWRDEEGTVLADGLAKIDAYARAEVGGGMALPDADIVDLGVL